MNQEKTTRSYVKYEYPANIKTDEQKRQYRRNARKQAKSAQYEQVKPLQGNPPAPQIQVQIPGIIALYRQPEPTPAGV